MKVLRTRKRSKLGANKDIRLSFQTEAHRAQDSGSPQDDDDSDEAVAEGADEPEQDAEQKEQINSDVSLSEAQPSNESGEQVASTEDQDEHFEGEDIPEQSPVEMAREQKEAGNSTSSKISLAQGEPEAGLPDHS